MSGLYSNGDEQLRILIVTGHFAGPSREPWLLDDLATALLRQGHTVDVVAHDATSPHPAGVADTSEPGLRVYSVGVTTPPGNAPGKLLAYLATGLKLHTAGFRWVRSNHYDLCLFTSIAAFSWGFPGRVRNRQIATKLVLFLWDFFPVHQLEIGRIKARWLAPLMKAAERLAIAPADVVALMSPANVRFFRSYHRGASNETVVIPPWSGAEVRTVDRAAAPTGERLRVIFGGQLARGRGVDALIAAAGQLTDDDRIDVFIAGDGPDRVRLERLAADRGVENVKFLGSLPREQYRSLAQTMHVGVAITVPGVTPPSFPSKIVEYCSLGLATLVCVEPSSDAGEIMEATRAGVSTPAGDPAAIAAALRNLSEELRSGELDLRWRAARQVFQDRFSAAQVAARMRELAGL